MALDIGNEGFLAFGDVFGTFESHLQRIRS